MKLAPMRFGGVSMRHNPEKLSISGKNRLQEYLSPCCEADSVILGRELCRVSGEGVLFGADCLEQYHTLEKLQHSHRPSKLVLPKTQPMYAYLKELSLSAESQDDVLRYRFVFCEAKSPRKATQGEQVYVTMSQGESLWDIAYRFGRPIEALTALNPQIPLIDEISEGERVRLC